MPPEEYVSCGSREKVKTVHRPPFRASRLCQRIASRSPPKWKRAHQTLSDVPGDEAPVPLVFHATLSKVRHATAPTARPGCSRLPLLSLPAVLQLIIRLLQGQQGPRPHRRTLRSIAPVMIERSITQYSGTQQQLFATPYTARKLSASPSTYDICSLGDP